MVLNSTQCMVMEIAPVDTALTLPYCIRGAMMGSQEQFRDERGILWQIRGATCREVPTTGVQAYLRDKVNP